MQRVVRRIIVGGAVTALFTVGGSVALAQPADDDDTQSFTMTVEEIFEITAPAAATATYSTEAGGDTFSDAQWNVETNYNNGATATFVASAFENQEDTDIKENVELSLAAVNDVNSVWTVDTATDTSDHAATSDASVDASSTGAGDTDFDLTVRMDVDDENNLAAGDYVTTVTGTLSANE